MSDAVMVALIGLGGTFVTACAAVITQVVLNRKNREKRKAESEEERKNAAVTEALKEERLKEQLKSVEHKLDIHNGYAERLGVIEKAIVVMETNLGNIEKLVSSLEDNIVNLYNKGA